MVAPAPAPGPSPDVDGVQLILGYCGVVTASLLIISPLPNIVKMFKEKQVGNEEPYTYIFVMFNAASWLIYAIPVLHLHDKTNTPVMIANGFGVLMECIYVIMFLVYVAADRRRMPLLTLIGAVCVSGVLLVLLLVFSVQKHVWSRTFMGWVAMLSGIAMYTIPLWRAYQAVRHRELDRLSGLQGLASLANGGVWTAYSVTGRHVRVYTMVANIVGACSASIQLVAWLVVRLRGPAPESEGVELGRQGQERADVPDEEEDQSQPFSASSTVNPPAPPIDEQPEGGELGRQGQERADVSDEEEDQSQPSSASSTVNPPPPPIDEQPEGGELGRQGQERVDVSDEEEDQSQPSSASSTVNPPPPPIDEQPEGGELGRQGQERVDVSDEEEGQSQPSSASSTVNPPPPPSAEPPAPPVHEAQNPVA